MVEQLTIENDEGNGRAFVLLYAEDRYRPMVAALGASIADGRRVITIRLPLLNAGNWAKGAAEFRDCIEARGLRHIHLIAFGVATVAAQCFCLGETKSARSLVLVDGLSRFAQLSWQRMMDTIEAALPLGLPWRNPRGVFDSRAWLQRIRCPVLLLSTPLADAFLRDEQRLFSASLPTSWRHELRGDDWQDALAGVIEDFLDVPAKCPQKGLGRM